MRRSTRSPILVEGSSAVRFSSRPTAPPSSRRCRTAGPLRGSGPSKQGRDSRRFDFGGPSAFSPDGHRLWIDTCVVNWGREDSRPPTFCVDPGGHVSDVSWSHEGSRVATSLYEGDIVLFDARTGKKVLTLAPDVLGYPLDVEISPDGKSLAAGFTDGTTRIWDLLGDTATPARTTATPATHVIEELRRTPPSSGGQLDPRCSGLTWSHVGHTRIRQALLPGTKKRLQRALYGSPLTDSNRRPPPYHGGALPTELRGQPPYCSRLAAGFWLVEAVWQVVVAS